MSRSRYRQRRVGIECIDHYERVNDIDVGGSRIKDVLRDPATGDWYIAKQGERWNDIEVVTEYIFYLVGRNIGAKVADAKIAEYRGCLRFLSKYFLDRSKGEELVHGVQLFQQIYDGGEVERVLKKRVQEQQMFTVQSVRAAFGAHYHQYGESVQRQLFLGFAEMLIHDAIVGMQDRHHENWGVIVRREMEVAPRFAPLYDSAAGLFGERLDQHLSKQFSGTRYEQALVKYIRKATPLIGSDGYCNDKLINHIELVTWLFWEYPEVRSTAQQMLTRYDSREILAQIRALPGGLCAPFRADLIRCCIKRRVDAIHCAIAAGPPKG